jgi:P-type Cu+ transporter
MQNTNTTSFFVEGMDCTTCALSITKTLQEMGLDDVKVNFATGNVKYTTNQSIEQNSVENAIESLGYTIKHNNSGNTIEKASNSSFGIIKTNLQRFLFCAIFALPLFIGHLVHIHFLMQPIWQLVLTIPVYIVGMQFFGRSAYKSVLKGMPNMNVLVTIGATAAMGYSFYGMLANKGMGFVFFETAATTITLVFFGNYLEEKSIEQTQSTLKQIAKQTTATATMIAFDADFKEQYFEVDANNLRVGDLIIIKSGEQVPADAKIISGDATVNESLLTGESTPIIKQQKDIVIAGSIIQDGIIKAQITAVGSSTVLQQIVELAQNAQNQKAPVQLLADKISAVFVPAVLIVAVVTFALNLLLAKVGATESLLRSIAVLVIACPCAMGLATPAAIAVGLGRAAKNGIVFKGADSLESFKSIKQIVFDKTGTLTTGNFEIVAFNTTLLEEEFKALVFSLEKQSSHPIAKSIVKQWPQNKLISFKTIEEKKGLGMFATDKDGNSYSLTSYVGVSLLTSDDTHQLYLAKNNKLYGWIDIEDAIRTEAFEVIKSLKNNGVKPIMLSGDNQRKCELVAKKIGIETVYSQQTPAQKLEIIQKLNHQYPTAMVGDGINDAPALAKATIGIAIGNASDITVQQAQVVLINGGLNNLTKAIQIGKKTYSTIQQNLFWALAYNVVAIPVAAFGLLGFYAPTYGALIMGLSDVVLVLNSLKLRFVKI